MTAKLKKWKEPLPLDILSDDMQMLDKSLERLEKSLGIIKRLMIVLLIAFSFLIMSAAVLTGTLIWRMARNEEGAHVRLVEFEGKYHQPWCERLIGKRAVEVTSTSGLSPCPDCIKGG